jgi:hypothetical protein
MAMSRGSALRIAALVVAVCSSLVFASGCAGGRERALQFADEFLRDVSSGQPDYGWSLLHPDIQRDAFNGDYEDYRALVEEADSY